MGQWIKDKVFGFADGIIDGFKSAFGIHSPSTVMRDSVGKYLAEGVGEGFMDELPNIAEEAREALTDLDLDAPQVGIDIIDPEAVLSNPPELQVSVPKIEAPELEISVPDISLPKLEIEIPDLPKPEPQGEPVPMLDTDTTGEPKRSPAITDDALSAMAVQQFIIDRSDSVPSATSDIISTQYTYNSTVNNNQTNSEIPPIALTAQFIVGEEVVAEGVLDIVEPAIDERQGLRVTMKRRGVTT